MHPESDAFLDTIFDNPGDDTPRLVYADWLEEHGQANYAQFIRLQCAAAHEKLWSDEANRLWEEIGRVWHGLHYDWWPATTDVWHLPSLMSVWDQHTNTYINKKEWCPGLLDATHFHRGLLRSDVPLTTAQAVRYSAFWPWIMTSDAILIVAGPSDTLAVINSNPVLRHVRCLRLEASWGEDNYEQAHEILGTFLLSPHLCRVRILDFTETYLNANAIEVLLTTKGLSSVEEVRLNDRHQSWHAGNEGLLILLKSRFKRVVCC